VGSALSRLNPPYELARWWRRNKLFPLTPATAGVQGPITDPENFALDSGPAVSVGSALSRLNPPYELAISVLVEEK
jgi:hypothetical protein